LASMVQFRLVFGIFLLGWMFVCLLASLDTTLLFVIDGSIRTHMSFVCGLASSYQAC
jgi:hypothetical protein